MVGTVEARKLRQKFADHMTGVRKRAADVRREIEHQRRLATGEEKALPPLNEKILEMLSRLALKNGFSLTKELNRIYAGGKHMAGVAYYDARNVRVDPRRMTDDTLAHEGFHNWLDDLQYSTNAKDRKLREDFLKLFEDTPEGTNWKKTAIEHEGPRNFGQPGYRSNLLRKGLTRTPAVSGEEQAVESLGLAMVERLSKRTPEELKRNTAKFKVLLRNARLRWKDKFGRNLTPDELKEYMLIKYEHDAPFLYNDDRVSGFVTHRLGKKPTEGKALSKWHADKQQLMNDVQAGNPVRLDATSPLSRAGDDPWKDLKFQEEKARYNSRGEVVATKKEEEEGLRLLREFTGRA
jgi:hypothetical protein